MAWLIDNFGTIAVLAILSAICIRIIIVMRKEKRSGCCGCTGCKGCSLYGSCGKAVNTEKENGDDSSSEK